MVEGALYNHDTRKRNEKTTRENNMWQTHMIKFEAIIIDKLKSISLKIKELNKRKISNGDYL